jgi:hypothetical protein
LRSCLNETEPCERNTIENLAAYLSTQLSSGRNDSGAARESKELELMEQEGMHV